MAERDAEYIWVNRWDEFQTYTLKRGKSWAPPWTKLYSRLLDDPAYLDLSPETRSLLVGIWMLFGRTRGTVTKDTRNLSRQLSQRVTERQLQRLSDAGFIQFCSGTVREQFWNTFRNGSTPEVEVEEELDKEPSFRPTVVKGEPLLGAHRKNGRKDGDFEQITEQDFQAAGLRRRST